MQCSKSLLSLVALMGTSLLCGCSEITKIQTQNKYLNATINPGVGLGDISLRSTSLREITAQLGRNYKREVRGVIGQQCEFGVCSTGRKETITRYCPG